jgi:predicted O-methyltransferase YrrM
MKNIIEKLNKNDVDGVNIKFDELIKEPEFRNYYLMNGSQEHYRLLATLSNILDNSVILDIGTFKGCSALALANNPTNKVYSFNITNELSLWSYPENIEFIIDDVISGGYDDIIKKSDLILLDTFHDGAFESKFMDYLKSLNYNGVVLFDDIFLNHEMTSFWNQLNMSKVDLTHLGHVTGTGCVFFENSTKEIIELVELKPKNKRRFLVHNPTNDITKTYRDYNMFWDDFTDALKEKYYVVENRFFKNAHFERFKIKLDKGTHSFLELLECEYVIEDLDNGEFYILSLSEQLSSCILVEKSNPFLKKVLYSQYIPEQIVGHTGEFSHKYSPWIFFPQNINDYEKYYNKRLEKTNFIDKLYFRGGTEYRPILNYIDREILSDNRPIHPEAYFEDLISHSVVLSIGGVANGDLCYRDIECMAMGVPILRFEYVTTLYPGLIPNYHYISVPLPLDLPQVNGVLKDRLGTEQHAKILENRFREVINNKEFLKFIARNARNYYNENLSRESRVLKTLKMLNL